MILLGVRQFLFSTTRARIANKKIEREHAKRLRNCSPTTERNDIIEAVNGIRAGKRDLSNRMKLNG